MPLGSKYLPQTLVVQLAIKNTNNPLRICSELVGLPDSETQANVTITIVSSCKHYAWNNVFVIIVNLKSHLLLIVRQLTQ
jgi:hypothetical protein